MAKSNKTAMTKSHIMGYLPNDQPPPVQMALLGFQHVLTMFPGHDTGAAGRLPGRRQYS